MREMYDNVRCGCVQHSLNHSSTSDTKVQSKLMFSDDHFRNNDGCMLSRLLQLVSFLFFYYLSLLLLSLLHSNNNNRFYLKVPFRTLKVTIPQSTFTTICTTNTHQMQHFSYTLDIYLHVHQRGSNRAVLERPALTSVAVPLAYRIQGRPIAFLRCQLATTQCFLLRVSTPRRWEQCASLNSVPKSQHTNPTPVSTGFDRKQAEATKPHMFFLSLVCSCADYFPVEVFRLHGTDGRVAASSVYM